MRSEQELDEAIRLRDIYLAEKLSIGKWLEEARDERDQLRAELAAANDAGAEALLLLKESQCQRDTAQAGWREGVEALRAIQEALKEPAGGSYWLARTILHKLEIYNDDLNDLRVLHAVAAAIVARFDAQGGK